MEAEPQPLDGGLRRRVQRMLRAGAEPDEVAKLLVDRGWEPGVARATAESADREYQDALRTTNMGKTHAPRPAVARAGGWAVALVTLFYLLKLVFRLLQD